MQINTPIARLINICRSLRAHHDKLTLTHLEAFLIIAEAHYRNNPVTGAELGELARIPRSKLYRVVWLLGDTQRKDPGVSNYLKWITFEEDPDNATSKVITLTEKGKAVYESLKG